MQDSQINLVNSLFLDGYSEKEAIHLSKIILSQRRVYKRRSIRHAVSYELNEAVRQEYRETVKKTNPFVKYRLNVDRLTDLVKHKIKGIEKRGFRDHHIDHIVPAWYGYKNGLPCELIADIDNLRMIPYKENMVKGTRMTKASRSVLMKLKAKYRVGH